MKYLSVFVLCCYVRATYSYHTGSAGPSNPMSGDKAFEYNMGPGLPIPYQTAPSTLGTQNNVQINLQAKDRQLSSHETMARHIASHPHLKEMYKKSIPTKRYTIVHPNGTIEHTNEIHAVTTRYPNYVMVKAADVLAHVNQPNVHGPPKRPTQNITPDQLNKPVTTNQNVVSSSSNSYSETHNNQMINNDLRSEVVSTAKSNSQSYSNSNSQESVVGSTHASSYQNVVSSNQRRKVIAGNPLPIYPTTSVPDVPAKYEPATKSSAASDHYLTITRSDSNSAYSNNNVENKIVSVNEIRPSINQIPIQSNEQEYLPVILPEVQQQTLQEIQTVAANEESQGEVAQGVTTIEEPVTSQNENNGPSSTILTNIFDPNAILDVGLSKEPSVFNQSSGTTHEPVTWFHLSDEKMLEALKQNTSNVYFFFLPPQPTRYREIRTTIYPNGTTTKDIVETDEDGNPKETNDASAPLT